VVAQEHQQSLSLTHQWQEQVARLLLLQLTTVTSVEVVEEDIPQHQLHVLVVVHDTAAAAAETVVERQVQQQSLNQQQEVNPMLL